MSVLSHKNSDDHAVENNIHPRRPDVKGRRGSAAGHFGESDAWTSCVRQTETHCGFFKSHVAAVADGVSLPGSAAAASGREPEVLLLGARLRRGRRLLPHRAAPSRLLLRRRSEQNLVVWVCVKHATPVLVVRACVCAVGWSVAAPDPTPTCLTSHLSQKPQSFIERPHSPTILPAPRIIAPRSSHSYLSKQPCTWNFCPSYHQLHS